MTPRPSPTETDQTTLPLPPGVEPLDGRDPRRVGPFRLVGRLGSGGMGVVYAALDDGDRRVAVKTVHRVFASDPEFRTRFAREADLVRRVRAACVPRFIGSDAHAEVPWLAAEYVPGPTLAEHLRAHGPLRGAALVLFALGAAEALAAIHAAGVVHRDLKPGNVILAPDGPKVLDFGIARAVEETALTRTGGVVGTPGWIAPEQYRGEDATGYSDVFAWACLVAHAATGREPFGAGGTDAVVTRVLDADPDLDGVPGTLSLVLEKALAKDQDRRPRAEALMRELAVLVPDEAAPAVAPGGDVDVTLVMGQVWRGASVRSGTGPGAGATGSAVGDEIDRWIAHAPSKEPWVSRHRRGIALGTGALVLVLVAAMGLGVWAGQGDGAPTALEEGSGPTETQGPQGDQGTGGDEGSATEESGSGAETEQISEDVPDEYRDLFENGRVLVEPDTGAEPAVVRRLVPSHGEGAGLDVARFEGESDLDPDAGIVNVGLEYFLDFGRLQVRTSDFVWASPSRSETYLEFDRLSPSALVVLTEEDEPVGNNIMLSLEERGDHETLHYLPRSATDDQDRFEAVEDLNDLISPR